MAAALLVEKMLPVLAAEVSQAKSAAAAERLLGLAA
jgi:hypothetical protein